jgi:hypothetical protein
LSSSGPLSMFQPVSWKPPLPFNDTILPLSHLGHNVAALSPKDPLNEEIRDRVKTARQNPNTAGPMQIPKLDNPPQRLQSLDCPFHKIGTDDNLVGLVISYIQTMLHKGRYPPFVHTKLYKCAEGDVIESLANAFCALAAKNASLPSSEEFVFMMINSERSRLVKAFVSHPTCY